MRPLNVKLLCCISFLIGVAIFAGCGGSSDPLDEIGYRYQILGAVTEDRDETTTDIDLWQDCDNIFDLTNDGDGEDPLTKATVTLSFEANLGAKDIWVYRIRIDYDLIEYHFGLAGDPGVTPSIASNVFDLDVFIPGDGGTSTEEIDLLSIVDKADYENLLGLNDAGLQTVALFQVTVTAYLTYTPSSPENDIELQKNFTINVANFADESCP